MQNKAFMKALNMAVASFMIVSCVVQDTSILTIHAEGLEETAEEITEIEEVISEENDEDAQIIISEVPTEEDPMAETVPETELIPEVQVEDETVEINTEEPMGVQEDGAEDVEEPTEEIVELEQIFEDIALKDETTGVTVMIPTDAMPEGITIEQIGLSVQELTYEQEVEAQSLVGEEKNIIKAYDICLIHTETGEEIQPAANVVVIIPEVQGAEGILEVHRINDDKTVTDLSITTEQSETSEDATDIIFETEHFTVYTITSSEATVSYLRDLIRNSSDTEIVIDLQSDVTWGTGSWEIIEVDNGKNVTINGNGHKFLRDHTPGTMIWVHTGAELTLNNVTMDGNGGEYFGNADYGWNGIPAYVKGVFVYNEGKLNLGEGTVLKNAHTKSDQPTGADGETHTTDLVKMAAPIFSQGGEVNLLSGSKITGNWFTANPTDGGNYYSAGAIIAAPSRDGNTKSVINMYEGAEISSNKVGFDYNPSNPSANLYLPEEEMNGSRVGNSFNSVNVLSSSYDRPTSTSISLRTPGAGGILLLSSDMNMYGGTISTNNGETGGIAINGVSTAFKDLYGQGHPKYDGDTSTDGENPVLLTWNDEKDLDVGLNVAEPASLYSTLNIYAGTIDNNLGISNGGIYAGRYAIVNLGTQEEIQNGKDSIEAEDDEKIVISNNRSWADYGGAGIGLSSQRDTHWGEAGNTFYRCDEQPVLNMYSGTIRNNQSSRKGGGIYIGTNEGHIYGGQIINNTALDEGGGIYVDAGYTISFTTITEIANNVAKIDHIGTATQSDADQLNSVETASNSGQFTAEEKSLFMEGLNLGKDGHSNFNRTAGYLGLGTGGGIWLCPEGQTTFNNIGMILLHDNTAVAAGDDLYNVIQSGMLYNNLLRLPESDSAGGEIVWLRDGGYDLREMTEAEQEALIESAYGTVVLTHLEKTDGYWYVVNPEDTYTFYDRATESSLETKGQDNAYDQLAVKSVYDPETLAISQNYVQLTISGNTSARGGGIASNGRLDFDSEEITTYEDNTIEIQKEWGEDTINQTLLISVGYESEGSYIEIGKIELNQENGYKGSITGLPSVTATDVELFKTQFVRLDDGKVDQGTAYGTPTENLILKEYVVNESGEKTEITANNYIQSIKYVGYEDLTEIENTTTYNGSYKNTRVKYEYTTYITNYQPSYKDITVNKNWETGTNPEEVEVQLYEGENVIESVGEVSGRQKLNSDNEWSYTWYGLDENKTYTVKETETDRFVATVGDAFGYWTKTSTIYPGAKVVISVEDNDTVKYLGIAEDGVTPTIKEALEVNGDEQAVNVPTDGVWIVAKAEKNDGYTLTNAKTGRKLAVSENPDWVITTLESSEEPQSNKDSVTWNNNGSTFQFHGCSLSVVYHTSDNITEYVGLKTNNENLDVLTTEQCGGFSIWVNTADTIQVTNSPRGGVSFDVTKSWDKTIENKTEVQMQLYQNGIAYGDPVTVSEATKWSYHWSNLPKTSGDGTEYVYSAVEVTTSTQWTALAAEDADPVSFDLDTSGEIPIGKEMLILIDGKALYANVPLSSGVVDVELRDVQWNEDGSINCEDEGYLWVGHKLSNYILITKDLSSESVSSQYRLQYQNTENKLVLRSSSGRDVVTLKDGHLLVGNGSYGNAYITVTDDTLSMSSSSSVPENSTAAFYTAAGHQVIHNQDSTTYGSMKVIKTDEQDKTIGLSQAQFDLYRVDSENGQVYQISGMENVKVVKVNENPYITDSNGEIYFANLPVGEYFLVETDAPTGYVKSETAIQLELKKDGVVLGQGNTASNVEITERKSYEIEGSGAITGLDSSWSLCLNGLRKHPNTNNSETSGDYVLHTNVSYDQMVNYIDYGSASEKMPNGKAYSRTTQLTETQYKQMQRILYWYLTYTGNKSNALVYAQQLLRLVTEHDESVALVNPFPGVTECTDGFQAMTSDAKDDEIQERLQIHVYENTNELFLQNMVTATIDTHHDSEGAVVVTNQQVSQDYVLPQTGGAGINTIGLSMLFVTIVAMSALALISLKRRNQKA